MNNYEEQRNMLAERNEKNKAWRKRLKIFYIGLFVPWGVLVVLILILESVALLPIDAEVFSIIMAATLAVWVLWLVFGIFYTRCPHCRGFLNRVPNNVKHCPHCATILKVYSDFEDTDLW